MTQKITWINRHFSPFKRWFTFVHPCSYTSAMHTSSQLQSNCNTFLGYGILCVWKHSTAELNGQVVLSQQQHDVIVPAEGYTPNSSWRVSWVPRRQCSIHGRPWEAQIQPNNFEVSQVNLIRMENGQRWLMLYLPHPYLCSCRFD